MLLDILMDPNCQAIVAHLGQSGHSRFSRIQKATKIDNKTLASKLKQLREGMVVTARTIPSKGDRVWLEYHLTPRGEAMYGVLQDLHKSLQKNRALAGVAKEFDSIFHGAQAVA